MKHILLLVPFCLFLSAALLGQTTRSLESFNKIDISGGYDKVLLQAGNSESVELKVSGIDPDQIVTEVRNHTLQIYTKKGHHGNFKATLTVTYKDLNAIHNSGSTDIVTSNTLKTDKFELSSSGSGDFNGKLDVNKLEIAISGSSDITLAGRADHQEFAISGSGDIKANTLSGKSAEVAISGSGDVVLHVDGPVHSHVSGSGNVKNN